jgi:signal peptidase I
MLDMYHTDKYYYKPIDKKTNYVKRCVGLPGDSLSIKDGYVYINGKQNQLPDRARIQFSYDITFKGNFSSNEEVYNLLNRYDITDGIGMDQQTNTYFVFAATEDAMERLKNHPNVASVMVRKDSLGQAEAQIFPKDPAYSWNNDFFGPLYIPKAGATIDLTPEILPLYKRAITEYEGHELSVNGNQISIDGKVANTFTFTKDYYWMMGDNRHNSQDSRYWGFVPFDHVVGKPVFVWMSWDQNGKPRWERFFTTVGGNGKLVSYLIPSLILAVILFGFNAWRKKRKANR